MCRGLENPARNFRVSISFQSSNFRRGVMFSVIVRCTYGFSSTWPGRFVSFIRCVYIHYNCYVYYLLQDTLKWDQPRACSIPAHNMYIYGGGNTVCRNSPTENVFRPRFLRILRNYRLFSVTWWYNIGKTSQPFIVARSSVNLESLILLRGYRLVALEIKMKKQQ